MRRTALGIAALLLAVPLAGCTQDTGDTGDGDGMEEPVEVRWVDEPQDMNTNETISMTWELTGPEREITHTGIHYANHSVDDPQSPGDYGNTTKAVEPAEVPGTFDAGESFEEPGTYYFIAHAIVDGEHIWADEIEVEVSESGPVQGPVSVTIESADEEVTPGETVNVTWQVTGLPSEVPHTGFHWANHSVEDPSSPADYGNDSGVREPADVPGTFNASFVATQPDTLYGRAHVIYEGSHYWSDEIEINVTRAAPAAENVTVKIRDEGPQGLLGATFDPQNVTVLAGGNVTWNNTGNASHQIDFENESLEDSPEIPPGETWTWAVPADLALDEYEYTDGATASSASGSVTVEAPDEG